MDSKTKQTIVSALCKHFSVDAVSEEDAISEASPFFLEKPFLDNAGENDFKTLHSNVLKSSGKEVSAQNNDILKWLEFAEAFPANSKDCFAALEKLNVEFASASVLLGNGLKPSAADVAMFSALHSSMVLCASNEDHSVVEPLLSPAGAKPGESVSFSGIEGKPEDVLNPKKKQLDKITPILYTDDNGVATFKGIPFMTSAGPWTSSIPKATIK